MFWKICLLHSSWTYLQFLDVIADIKCYVLLCEYADGIVTT